MRTMVLVLMILALPGGGCVHAKDRVTDGDRGVVHQGYQACHIAMTQLELAFNALTGAAQDVPAAIAALQAAAPPLDDAKLGLEQLGKNFGPPEKPEPYSRKKMQEVLKQSADEHASTDWLGILQKIGIGIATALTVAATVLNLPYVGPWLATTRAGQFAARVVGGKTAAVAQDALKTISVIRSESEVKPLGPADVVRLAVATFSKSTAAIADKVSDQIEARANIKVTAIDDLKPAAGTPS